MTILTLSNDGHTEVERHPADSLENELRQSPIENRLEMLPSHASRPDVALDFEDRICRTDQDVEQASTRKTPGVKKTSAQFASVKQSAKAPLLPRNLDAIR